MHRQTSTDGRVEWVVDDDGILWQTDPLGQRLRLTALDTQRLYLLLHECREKIQSGAEQDRKHLGES